VDRLDHYRGSLLGLAAGDALGTTVEFAPPNSFEPLTDIVGGGPFRLPVGAWTDDTSMALCLAESLVLRGEYDPIHQLQTYVRWYQDGHRSSIGRCFDIGGTTRAALMTFERTGAADSGPTSPYSAGNGSIMRLCPVPLAFAHAPETAIALSGASSKTTHGLPVCMDACRYMGALIVGAVQGRPKDELLAAHFCPVPGLWDREPLHEKIAAIAAGSFKSKEPPAIRGSGYVVDSLEAALWAFHRSADFRTGALLAVNLGDDADTTGAVYGQIAGAFYGLSGIPLGWREKIVHREAILTLADELLALSERLKI
jgi:ADP-ribosylglycohydrolase